MGIWDDVDYGYGGDSDVRSLEAGQLQDGSINWTCPSFYVLIPKVWASIVDLLAPLEEVDEFQGIVEQLAEAVSFESQARADNLDIMPIQLAREVKSVKKGEVEEMPSLKAVSSFLKEVQKERSEVEEVQQFCEERELVNSDGVEESFSRLGQEIAKFNTKYQVCSGSFSYCSSYD